MTFAKNMIIKLSLLSIFLLLVGCNKNTQVVRQRSSEVTNDFLNEDMKQYKKLLSTLKPQSDYEMEGSPKEEPWTDTSKFRSWLESKKLSNEDTNAVVAMIPAVSLALNHGPLFGVEAFIEANFVSYHKVNEAGFLIVGSGPNGDYIVVDIKEGWSAGWLPMAMVGGMTEVEVRSHYVSTNTSMFELISNSEENWSEVAKDWYSAKEKHNGKK